MAGPNYNLVQEIFEQSVVDALSMYGIGVELRANDDYSNYNPRKVFLREAILNKLEYQYTYSSQFRNDVAFDPVTGDFNKDKVREIVKDYVTKEIRLETGRMQVDAERKILENIVEGQYFKEGGGKKFIENAIAVVSPDSAKFNKLLGTKLTSQNQDAYRKAVLDVVFSRTADGLVSEIARLDKVAGDLKRPALSTSTTTTELKGGQTFAKAVVDILDPSTKETKISTPYLSTAKKIKKEYDDRADVKAIKKEIETLRTRALVDRAANSEIQIKERELQRIFEIEPLASGLSTKQSLEVEQTRLNTVLVNTSSTGLISEQRRYQFYDPAKAISSNVWESHPELKIKLIEYQEKLAATSSPVRRAHYQKLIDSYTAQLSAVSASNDAFSFSFSGGEIVLSDRLRGNYDKATRDFAQGLKFLDFSSEYNNLRIRHMDVDIQNIKNLINHLENKANKTPDEFLLLQSSRYVLKRFDLHSQALSIVEGMKKLNPLDPEFVRWKTEFLANIDEYESDPQIKAQIVSAINSNDRRALKKLINSGSGNTAYDAKHEALYEELYTLGHQSREMLIARGLSDDAIKGFAVWINKRELDNELIKSFVVRKQVETIIYAAQLMTDGKYLQKEVKRLVTEEVKQRLVTNMVSLFPYNQYAGELLGVIYEASQQDKPMEWLAKEGRKKIVDIFKTKFEEISLFKNLQKNLDSFKLLGVELKVDIYDFAKNPAGYLGEKAMFIAKNWAEKGMNFFFRGSVEKLFNFYVGIKTQIRSLITFVTEFAKGVLTRYGGALGARIVAMLAGAAIPGIGWIATAVIALLPVLLKPIFGDVDIATMLKKTLKFVCLLPLGIFFLFWLILVVPITTLFANVWPSFFGSVWQDFTTKNYEYSMEHDWTFGVANEFELTYELANGLVTTSGNTCIKDDGSPIYPPSPKIKGPWNNLRTEDFDGLATPLNCKIMCNAQIFMLTMYPGVNGMINCNSTADGQKVFFPNAQGNEIYKQKFFCSYTVAKAYRDDFNELDGSAYAGVSALDSWFRSKLGTSIERIDPKTCFNKNRLKAGAGIILTRAQNCTFGGGGEQHAVLFLKLDENKKTAVYVNTNSGVIREELPYESCGGDDIKLKDRDYGSFTLYTCSIYQPTSVPGMNDANRCPTNCIPDKKNY